MEFIKKLIEKLKHRKIHRKIAKLEKEIEDLRELTTNNYWKLKKEIKGGRNRKFQKKN
jgi:hypothetical protein